LGSAWLNPTYKSAGKICLLLYTLMTHYGHILSTESIVERVWGYTGRGDRDLVRGLVRRLRTMVEPDPRNPVYILTVPGVGYSFEPDHG
jgi:DNA-binding response OmpR family regulator